VADDDIDLMPYDNLEEGYTVEDLDPNTVYND
jgi:hypothetical protein